MAVIPFTGAPISLAMLRRSFCTPARGSQLELFYHVVVHEGVSEEGCGIGLSVRVPGMTLSPQLRALGLPDFPTVPLCMMWRDDDDRLLRVIRTEVEKRAAELSLKAQKCCSSVQWLQWQLPVELTPWPP
jgi:hypothetical protein